MKSAKALFSFSILYLFAIFATLLVDTIVARALVRQAADGYGSRNASNSGLQRRAQNPNSSRTAMPMAEDQHRFCVHDRLHACLEKEYRRKPAIASRALARALSDKGRDKFHKNGMLSDGAGRGLA